MVTATLYDLTASLCRDAGSRLRLNIPKILPPSDYSPRLNCIAQRDPAGAHGPAQRRMAAWVPEGDRSVDTCRQAVGLELARTSLRCLLCSLATGRSGEH